MSNTGVYTRKKYELTPEVVEELKKLLEANSLEPKIYKFVNDGDTIVFRPLMFFDYTDIQAFIKSNGENVTQDDIDRKICEKAVVWPGEMVNPMFWEVQRAGLQSTLAKQILARSAFIVEGIDQSGYMSVESLVTVPMGIKPDEATIAELKSKYNWSLYSVQCDNEWFVVRPISRAEWRSLTTTEAADLDLMIAERITVWSKEYPNPCNFSVRAAGVAGTISEISTGYSGFNKRSTVEEL
ncbi:MAG TPA: hypothetical protein VEP90_16595 [Methylomirabilota bacterium]|nr:hypothetical protein [Methylomirabilota bacterium]